MGYYCKHAAHLLLCQLLLEFDNILVDKLTDLLLCQITLLEFEVEQRVRARLHTNGMYHQTKPTNAAQCRASMLLLSLKPRS